MSQPDDAASAVEETGEAAAPESFREWLRANLTGEDVRDLARYGADAGFPGLTHTGECVALYDRFKDDIRAALEEDADALGYDSPEAFVASFNRSDLLWQEDGRKTLLVWYLAERVAREVTEDR